MSLFPPERLAWEAEKSKKTTMLRLRKTVEILFSLIDKLAK